MLPRELDALHHSMSFTIASKAKVIALKPQTVSQIAQYILHTPL